MDRPGFIDRRGLLVAAAALLAAPSAVAQDPPAPADPEARLLTNLFTRMATPVELDGRGRWDFVLDTGAGRTAIAADLAARLGLPPGPPVLVHGITEAAMAPTVEVGRLTFGGRRFQRLTCPVFPREMLAADGLLGLDVLSRFRLTLDMTARRVRLAPSDGGYLANGPTFSTPTRLRTRRARRGRFGQLILPTGRVGDVAVDAFVDSGAQYSIGNPALMRAIGLDASPDGLRRIEVFGVTGQTRQAVIGQVSGLVLSGRDLGPTELLFSDLHAFRALELEAPALLIGADLLRRFRTVVLDFGRGRMAMQGLRPAD